MCSLIHPGLLPCPPTPRSGGGGREGSLELSGEGADATSAMDTVGTGAPNTRVAPACGVQDPGPFAFLSCCMFSFFPTCREQEIVSATGRRVKIKWRSCTFWKFQQNQRQAPGQNGRGVGGGAQSFAQQAAGFSPLNYRSGMFTAADAPSTPTHPVRGSPAGEGGWAGAWGQGPSRGGVGRNHPQLFLHRKAEPELVFQSRAPAGAPLAQRAQGQGAPCPGHPEVPGEPRALQSARAPSGPSSSRGLAPRCSLGCSNQLHFTRRGT